MNADRARTFLLALPHVVETAQWGGIVFWVGDKAVGGKMFAMVNPDGPGELPISFAAGPERCAELLEVEGLRPAPYFARIHWVAAERWDALRPAEWEEALRHAHALTLGKLPGKVKATLALPARELRQVVAARRAVLKAKAVR